ncbi:hypothetical protein BCR36DRAFT_582968 [Piromyces finnis]|uniref:Transglutaminase-like domain-containing protein n=1 Tax=Piromyces finnis TaxID=1754191 RepID=A0A1Y1VAN6_9FUNG|nr:hypothetical protein BCR36DRAFT_582968 [Piromyces finnis]|eukprot:ORX51423.1 hypothetical protein BCR36DRAFT_582968 [Piromyces finnis]
MIPIKFWTNEEKDELQEQLNDNADISEIDDSVNFSFYNQLSSLEQKYYDSIYSNSVKSPPDLTIKVSLTMDTSNPKAFIAELQESAEKVFTAVVYENPELWWLGTYTLKLSYNKTKYIITFNTVPSNSKFSVYTKYDIANLNQEIEQSKKVIMEEIAKLNLTTNYAIIRYIHDFLAVKNVYTLNENLLHIRTIYGSLVENKCVCEGYAEAFQYIAQQYGINCIIGRSSTHEWNYVEMDGKWYAVDVTFDDRTSKGVTPLHNTYNNIITEYFLIGTDHIDYKKKKFSEDKDHILVYSGYSNEHIVSYPYIEAEDYVPSDIELMEIELIDLSEIASITTTRKTTTTTKSTTPLIGITTTTTANIITNIEPTTINTTNNTNIEPTTIDTTNNTNIEPTTVDTTNNTNIEPTTVDTTFNTNIEPTTVDTTNNTNIEPTTIDTTNNTNIEPTTVDTTNNTNIEPTTVDTTNNTNIESTTIDTATATYTETITTTLVDIITTANTNLIVTTIDTTTTKPTITTVKNTTINPVSMSTKISSTTNKSEISKITPTPIATNNKSTTQNEDIVYQVTTYEDNIENPTIEIENPNYNKNNSGKDTSSTNAISISTTIILNIIISIIVAFFFIE